MNRVFHFGVGLRECPLCGAQEAQNEREAWLMVYLTEEERPGLYGTPSITMYTVQCGSCCLKLSRANLEAARTDWNHRAGDST